MARPRTAPSDNELERLKRKIRDPGSSPYAKVCVYGVNGSGKTRLAGSAPKVLVVTFPDEEDRSIRGVRGTKVIEVTRWEEIGQIYWYLKGGKHPFQSVSLDTVTAMNNLALTFVLGEAEARDPTRERAQPDKRTWGRAGQLMRAMLLAYKNLPMHVIFCAQERRVRDQDTEELLEITVDLPNSSRGVAMGSVGILGRMLSKEARVRTANGIKKQWTDNLVLAPHEIIRTKDQTHLLEPVLRQPTMTKIINAWRENPPGEEEA